MKATNVSRFNVCMGILFFRNKVSLTIFMGKTSNSEILLSQIMLNKNCYKLTFIVKMLWTVNCQPVGKIKIFLFQILFDSFMMKQWSGFDYTLQLMIITVFNVKLMMIGKSIIIFYDSWCYITYDVLIVANTQKIH